MIQLDDLRVVVAVAQHESFVVAAEKTGVPTSTVSRAVARFEEAVGARIFQRTSRKVALTDVGARLLERATPSLDDLEETLDTLSNDSIGMKGKLRVTAPIVSGADRIADGLLGFAAAHPGVSVDLSLSNTLVDLVDEGVDLAFRGGPMTGADLVAQKIGTVPFAIGASKAFVKREPAIRKRLTRSALETLPAIVSKPGAPWTFRGAKDERVDVVPQARFCANDPRVAVKAAQKGLGIVRAPRDLIVRAGLVVLEPEASLGALEARAMYAVYPSRRLVPKRVRLAIEWVRRAWNDGDETRAPKDD